MASTTDQTTDVLRRRLASAEQDTQQLMKQLEEMGFSTTSKEKISNPRIPPVSVSVSDKNSVDNSNGSARKKDGEDAGGATGSVVKVVHQHPEQAPHDSTAMKATNPKENTNGGENEPKSSKHKPITPFSLRGLAMPNLLEGSGVKTISDFAPQSSKAGEGTARRKQRHTAEDETRVGRHELEQELLRVKRVASQLEEEVAFEAEAKLRAREEAEKMKSLLEEFVKSQAEQEMKIEDLSAVKQKLTRVVTERKEEVSREASLRSSLEESHKTLLSRLQDMEAVIETLRSEGKTQMTCSNSFKAELVKVKDELDQEVSRRRKIEDVHVVTVAERDRLKLSLTTSLVETQKTSTELGRLQAQYTELISQLGQAQQVTDTLKTGKTTLEEEKYQLCERVKSLTSQLEALTLAQQETKESETRLFAEKSAMESDYCRMKDDKEKTQKALKEREKKMETMESELKASRHSLTQKNQEFSSAANGLERELSGLRSQLEDMENEKQNVLRDKESLLEEVNQTVDTLMSERSRLQTELQASLMEGEALRNMCAKLEQDNAQMLERLSSFQHHQSSHMKVEDTLKQMMEAKNRLAYDNGKLQSTIQQLTMELDSVSREQGDVTQMKKLCQSLQAKYTQSQQEISEYKISLQRAEVQARSAVEEMEVKDRELRVALSQRQEVGNELEKVAGKLEVLEDREVYKVHNYKKSMEEAKVVNQDMANTLEAVMTSHGQLQTIVENLQVELGKRDSQICQIKSSRNKEIDELKIQLTDYEEKTESLKAELKREKDSIHKKSAKDLSEVKKQRESLSTRNQELVKLNTELRQRLSQGEKDHEDLKVRLTSQRHKMEYQHRAKKQLEDNLNKMKTVRDEISELERMRDEYIKKNKDQAETISKFICQMSSLQEEVKQLAHAHQGSQELLKLKEEALEKERRISHEMRKKYSDSKRRELETVKEAQGSNEKLKEVHSESLEISKHLQEAHEWFRGKFDKLQTELVASKQTQAQLARDNREERQSLEAERSKAEVAAQRAKDMIQSSRQTISRLASFAEMADADTKQQMAKIRAGLQTGTVTVTGNKAGLTTGTAASGKLSMADLET